MACGCHGAVHYVPLQNAGGQISVVISHVLGAQADLLVQLVVLGVQLFLATRRSSWICSSGGRPSSWAMDSPDTVGRTVSPAAS